MPNHSLRASAAFYAICIWAATALHLPATAATPSACSERSRDELASVVDRWHSALDSGQLEHLEALYAGDAVLLPAMSAAPRAGTLEIRAFFREFLERHPRLTVTMRTIVAGCDMGSEMGTISYRVTGRRKGTHMLIAGRTTTVFAQREGRWLIVQQSLSLSTRPNRSATPAF
jgi:uncharacterized protein (TIGR02246 family)